MSAARLKAAATILLYGSALAAGTLMISWRLAWRVVR